KIGELILDPFCGSGTIIIACEMTGRHARAIEYEPRYADGAIGRYQGFTGKQVILEATGETFEDVQERRRLGETAQLISEGASS
ncbi:MAG: adenine methyltransferase YhdJ, partial [Pseudomonadota bacterium]